MTRRHNHMLDVLDELSAHPTPTVGEIAEALGLSAWYVRQTMARLVRRGLVTDAGGLTPDGAAALRVGVVAHNLAPTTSDRVVGVLRLGPSTCPEVARRLAIGIPAVRTALHRLARDGRVVQLAGPHPRRWRVTS